MSRPTIPFMHLLFGATPPLPEYTASRVHRMHDDPEPEDLSDMTAAEVAERTGLTRQAARVRIQKARATDDWSSLLAPPFTTPAAQSASTARGPERKGAMSTDTVTSNTTAGASAGKGKTDFERGAAHGRREAMQIIAYAQRKGQLNAGLALLKNGLSAEQARKAIDALVQDQAEPIGRDEATQAWARENRASAQPADPAAVVQAILAAGRKAGAK